MLVPRLAAVQPALHRADAGRRAPSARSSDCSGWRTPGRVEAAVSRGEARCALVPGEGADGRVGVAAAGQRGGMLLAG